MKTRQAILVEKGRIELQEKQIELQPDQVLVEMQGCGLCAWELNHWAGLYGKPPMPLGHEGWGTVVDVDSATSGRIKIGDRVTGVGSADFADYFVLPEKFVMRLTNPQQKEIPGEPLCCVQNVLRAAHPEVGDTVVVLGCGPMGQWVIQGLAAPQLRHLIAVDIDERKLDLARRHGATQTINPKTCAAAEVLREINEGRQADIAIEGTGTAAGMQLAVELLRPRRPRLVVMSSFRGRIEVDLPLLCEKAVEVLHAHPGIAKDPEDCVRRTELLINKGVFTTDGLISHRFALDEIMTAFRTLESRPAGYLKGIVVR